MISCVSINKHDLLSSFSPALFKCWRGHGWQLDVKEHDPFVWSTLFRSHQLTRHLGHDPKERSTMTFYLDVLSWTQHIPGVWHCIVHLKQLHLWESEYFSMMAHILLMYLIDHGVGGLILFISLSNSHCQSCFLCLFELSTKKKKKIFKTTIGKFKA